MLKHRRALSALAIATGMLISPTTATATTAPLTSKATQAETKVCSNGRVYLAVRNITCRNGKRIIRLASEAFWETEDGETARVGQYRCTYPAYLGDIRCKHVDKRTRKWVRQASE